MGEPDKAELGPTASGHYVGALKASRYPAIYNQQMPVKMAGPGRAPVRRRRVGTPPILYQRPEFPTHQDYANPLNIDSMARGASSGGTACPHWPSHGTS